MNLYSMENPTILELRGNGALVRTFLISNTELKHITELAEKYGEPIETAWFDPAFRWKKNVRELIESLDVVSEHRGLFADSRSFLEVRRHGKRRVKFLMEELLGDGLLFPQVQLQTFQPLPVESETKIIIEITYGVGCLAQFEVENFDLVKLDVLLDQSNYHPQRLVLFNTFSNNRLDCLKDDFLVRQQQFTVHTCY